MNAHTLANPPRCFVYVLLALLFIVAPCLMTALDDADGLNAARLTAAAARDVERQP